MVRDERQDRLEGKRYRERCKGRDTWKIAREERQRKFNRDNADKLGIVLLSHFCIENN